MDQVGKSSNFSKKCNPCSNVACLNLPLPPNGDASLGLQIVFRPTSTRRCRFLEARKPVEQGRHPDMSTEAPRALVSTVYNTVYHKIG